MLYFLIIFQNDGFDLAHRALIRLTIGNRFHSLIVSLSLQNLAELLIVEEQSELPGHVLKVLQSLAQLHTYGLSHLRINDLPMLLQFLLHSVILLENQLLGIFNLCLDVSSSVQTQILLGQFMFKGFESALAAFE